MEEGAEKGRGRGEDKVEGTVQTLEGDGHSNERRDEWGIDAIMEIGFMKHIDMLAIREMVMSAAIHELEFQVLGMIATSHHIIQLFLTYNVPS